MAGMLIECVPNFSEGCRKDVIEKIVEPFRTYEKCYLLDYRADPDHNRLVVSLVGEPAPIQDALIESSKIAIANIDMKSHTGGHPRIGAIDVIPFSPIKNITINECINIAHQFGDRFNKETGIPVFFYEDAARTPERKRLEIVRKGQYETLKSEIQKTERKPDIGEASMHHTAGATAIGARKLLVAYNVNLKTSDVEIAKKIADTIRSSSGGFTHVKGIGLSLEDRGMVQVSMNITDFEKNPIYRVQELIKIEAKRWGVEVGEAEVYGMIPQAALMACAEYYLQIAGFNNNQVIENCLLDIMGDDVK
ncbi:MAG: glutamate formimidoyltransferase [Desulfobacterales bacterium]|nr:glutamate formimidoyltransferase [Desulfobacterales bacterium]